MVNDYIEKEISKKVYNILLIAATQLGMLWAADIAYFYKLPTYLDQLICFGVVTIIQLIVSNGYNTLRKSNKTHKKIVCYICTVLLSSIATGIFLQGNGEKALLMAIMKNSVCILVAILLSHSNKLQKVLYIFWSNERVNSIGGIITAILIIIVMSGGTGILKLILFVTYILFMSSTWNEAQDIECNISNMMCYTLLFIEISNVYLIAQVGIKI